MRVKALTLLLVALFGAGCSSPTVRVATHMNGYDFLESLYEERCVVTGPPAECIIVQTDLKTYEKHLHGAAKALKNGGGMPLQLKALKDDAKTLSKRAVLK